MKKKWVITHPNSGTGSTDTKKQFIKTKHYKRIRDRLQQGTKINNTYCLHIRLN